MMTSQPSPIAEAPSLKVERHIMRRGEVERKTGFKRAHIYNLMKEGKFPQAKRIDCARSAGTRWKSSSGSLNA